MERTLARLIVLVLVAGALTLPLAGALLDDTAALKVYARMSEYGGWSFSALKAQVGEPLELRLTSEDVVHGFAVGRLEGTEVAVLPGRWSSTTLLFEQPGIYTFYCTRWCGEGHWRMRGTIEVAGPAGATRVPSAPPRYMQWGLDIDVPHPATVIPEAPPSATRGAAWAGRLPVYALQPETYWRYSPAELWEQLRAEATLARLRDADVWDLVAWIWYTNVGPEDLALGERLYREHAAVAHGEEGKGDGVGVRTLSPYNYEHNPIGQSGTRPPDFTDPRHTLGAPPAALEGKLLRGGMGTGMPAYGEIFTAEEIAALVGYIYTFVMTP